MIRRRVAPVLPTCLIVKCDAMGCKGDGMHTAPPAAAAVRQAQVIEGVAPMSTVPVTWRIVHRQAQPAASARAASRTLGFTLTARDSFLITDQATKQQVILDQAKGTIGDGDLVFAGDGFTMPKGTRQLALSREIMRGGETSSFVGSKTPMLIFVTDGSLTVTDRSGSPRTLNAGKAALVSDNLALNAAKADGALRVTTFSCPQGVDPSQSTDGGQPGQDAAGDATTAGPLPPRAPSSC